MERTGETEHSNLIPFLLLNSVIRQSGIYIFTPRKSTTGNYTRDLLTKYSLTGVSLNEIARIEEQDPKNLVRYLSENTSEIGIYFTE
jgi:hypothetical protein